MKESPTPQTEFEAIRAQMRQQGCMEYEKTISAVLANVLVILAAGPIAALLIWLYRARWGDFDFSFSVEFASTGALIFLAVLIISIPLHEFLHGFTWQFFCQNRWKSIQFGVLWKILTPYCHCKEPLGFWKYGLGILMPFLVLGVLTSAAGILTQSPFWLSIGLINILAAGGDIIIMLTALKYHDARLLDHPTKCGFVAFRKP